jgi:hypothetical protein
MYGYRIQKLKGEGDVYDFRRFERRVYCEGIKNKN